MENELGLTDLVRVDDLGIDDVAQQTEAPNLTVITAGTIPANPAELLGSKRMEAIVERLKGSADIIVFDTPPVTAVTDAAVMAAKADATIIVIQGHRTSRRIVTQGLEALTKVNARIVGAVLNNVPGHVATPYYGRSRAYGEAGSDAPIDRPSDVPLGTGMASDLPMETRQAEEALTGPVEPARPVTRRPRGRPRATTPNPPRPASDLDGANR
jgi:Mrp family chromosome partitioning ATPase